MAEEARKARGAGRRSVKGGRSREGSLSGLKSAWLDGGGRWPRPAAGINYAVRAMMLLTYFQFLQAEDSRAC